VGLGRCSCPPPPPPFPAKISSWDPRLQQQPDLIQDPHQGQDLHHPPLNLPPMKEGCILHTRLYLAPTVQPLRVVQPDAVCEVGGSTPGLSHGDLAIFLGGGPNREICTLAEKQQTHWGRPFQSA